MAKFPSNYLICCASSGYGIMNSAASGDLVADLLLQQSQIDSDSKYFGVDRFENGVHEQYNKMFNKWVSKRKRKSSTLKASGRIHFHL